MTTPLHATLGILYLLRVKAYVVRAEDARLLGDMPLVRKMYAELHTLNRRLVGEYAKRANNHRVSRRAALLSVVIISATCTVVVNGRLLSLHGPSLSYQYPKSDGDT